MAIAKINGYNHAVISLVCHAHDALIHVCVELLCSVIPKEKPKALVIPLIKRNEWQTKKNNEQDDGEKKKRPADTSEKDAEQRSKKKKDERKPSTSVDSLESEAVKEIMEGGYLKFRL